MLPRIAVTGASRARISRISGSPTSPACRIWSTPRMASSASGRSSPWVSEITPTRTLNSHPEACTRVEIVPQRVAEKVEGEDAEHDRKRRKNNKMRRIEKMRWGSIQQRSPARRWRWNPKAQEAECRLRKTASRHADGRLDDQRLND